MPLTKEEVLQKMKEPAVVLLNVLSGKDYLKLNIKGSESFPLGQNIRGFATSAEKKYGKQTFFITYGADAGNSAALNAVKILRDKGLRADHYTGGVKEWAEAGLPLAGTESSRSKVKR